MSTSSSSKIGAIAPVPTSNEFLDIILSKTQRKTPTQIHNGMKISRIRSFYMRKVKFTQDAFHEKLDAILLEFPQLDNLHPFLSALLNVLYDKNHYKLALGELNTARHLIDQVGKDYVRLLKFGDSLYRCKQLKKAALGRMATIMRRQKDPLSYLEQVRQHMLRLPTIDPTTRTLVVCGYPNVGKSSFINSVTRADVDVQPYAFTTKSLFVGHMDYKYLRWQVIDTPGILDHPLEEMNTIEMQSVTALAHLRSAVMYFMDISEQCGYTVEAQCNLFNSIKPLFGGKPTYVVVNKIDVIRLNEIAPEKQAMINDLTKDETYPATLLQLSCLSTENLMDVRNSVCDGLLAHRVAGKEKSHRVDSVASRLRVAQPVKRDNVDRKPFVPESVAHRVKYDKNDPNRRILERDLEEQNGGAGVYQTDLKKNYLLKNDEWKHDTMPEIFEGKNIADFIDPDIMERLEELEEEEKRLEQEGFYDDNNDMEDSDDEVIRAVAKEVRKARKRFQSASAAKNSKLQNNSMIPRSHRNRTVDEMLKDLEDTGHDTTKIREKAKAVAEAQAAKKKLESKRKRDNDDESMDVDDSDGDFDSDDSDQMDLDNDNKQASKKKKVVKGGVATSKHVPQKNRAMLGVRDAKQAKQLQKMEDMSRRTRNREGKRGDADRAIAEKMPKHLYSGKRGSGTASRR